MLALRSIPAVIASMAVLAFLTRPAAAAHVWVFGDSNMDSGWYRVSPFSGSAKFDFDLALSATYGIGKPTNNPGPMSVEVLARLMGTTATPANQGGTNYATSGAKNVNPNTSLNGGFPNAVPTRTQISSFIHRHPLPGIFGHPGRWTADDDLFVVDSGANDIGYAIGELSGFTVGQQQDYVRNQAAALAQDVKGLQKHGAKHIIVVGQPESFGAAAQQAARQLYDAALRNALDAGSVQYAWADLDQVRKDIIADPGTFHIVHTTTAADQVACAQPNAALNITTAWALLCSAQSPVTNPTAFADQALFADDQHWSAAAQKVLGSYFFCLARSAWPQPEGPRTPFPWLHPSQKPPFGCTGFSAFKLPEGPPAGRERPKT